MRRGIFVALLLTVIIALYSLYLVNDKCIYESKFSSLLLENIEALAADEDGMGDEENEEGRIRCLLVGTLDCPVSHQKVKKIYGGYRL